VSYFELPTEVLCEKHSSEISLLAWAFDLYITCMVQIVPFFSSLQVPWSLPAFRGPSFQSL
jgi:hypothetical protein